MTFLMIQTSKLIKTARIDGILIFQTNQNQGMRQPSKNIKIF